MSLGHLLLKRDYLLEAEEVAQWVKYLCRYEDISSSPNTNVKGMVVHVCDLTLEEQAGQVIYGACSQTRESVVSELQVQGIDHFS